MIRLGLRMAVAGGREAVARLVIIAFATALGVGMVLSTLATIHAVNAQNDRYAWLQTGHDFGPPAAVPPGTDPLWWRIAADEYRGRLIGRVDVAATGPHAPVPPGLTRLPGPGEYYASPALVRLLHDNPRSQLADRFAGRLVGALGPAGVPSPESLIVVVGHRPGELAGDPRARLVHSISTTSPSQCHSDCLGVAIDADGMKLVLGIAAVALLLPVLIFIGAASRLSAARREQRFAAMRLVGATPRQISVLATVESAVAACAGVVLGFAAYLLARPTLAGLPFTGSHFYEGDLRLRGIDVVVVALGVPIAAAAAARLAMRRVTISPLGVSRRVTPPAPRAWRLLPVLAGLGELTWFVLAGRPGTTQGQLVAYLTGIAVTMVGLVIAGPWLTLIGARAMSRGTGRPAVLLAGRRLGDDPRGGFRAVSGLVLALFVASVSVGVMATIRAEKEPIGAGANASGTLLDRFGVAVLGGSVTSSRQLHLPTVPPTLVAELRAIPGVHGVTLVRQEPAARFPDPFSGLVRCADLPATPALGRCPAGATAARIVVADRWLLADGRKAVEPIADRNLDRLPVSTIAVDAGSAAAVERARTLLEQVFGHRFYPMTVAEERDQLPSVQRLKQYQQLADVVVLVSLVIAGCSLAVSVAGGLSERKRPFALLRLSGAPLGTVRKVVLLESGLPLVVVSAVSAGIGFLSAELFVRSQLRDTLRSPDAGYFLSVALGLLVALAVTGSTLPVLRRLTGPETARNG